MLKPLPDEALAAMAQAHAQPRWRDIDKALSEEIQAVFQRMLGSHDTAILHEMRGRARALQEFQAAVREARESLASRGIQAPL